MKALVISGCPNTAADSYRVSNLIEELCLLGWEYVHSNFSNLFTTNRNIVEKLNEFQIVYSHRCPYSAEYDELIKKAESLHIPAVYDTDDYIFDASVMPYVRAIQDWSQEKKEHYLGDLLSYERALRLHRYGVAPTSYLAARMKEKGLEKAFVLPNCLSSEMRVSAEEALYEEIRGAKIRESLNIGFFSGTRTHDADFLVAAAGLDLVLEKNKQVRLMIVGELEIPGRFRAIAERADRHPLVKMHELYQLIVKTDINIAPLEIDNPYCQAKSELKYFDAGIVGVPTVASATEAYKTAIVSGRNGFLASSEKEWAQCLKSLVKDEALRESIGLVAKRDAYERYTTSRVCSHLGEILAEML